MPVRSCRVTIRDLEGVEHTVQVTASTLYEAVALGLAALRGQEWVAGVADGLNVVRVAVVNIPAEHSVVMKDFKTWLEKTGGHPKDISNRNAVRKILGIRPQ